MTRLAAVQRWPDVPNADQTMPSTARSMSASSRTMIAFLPPSSRWTRLSRSAAAFVTATPVSREPVSVMTGTSGCVTIALPTSPPPPCTTLTTPAGTPAFAAHIEGHVHGLLHVAARLREHLAHLVRHQLGHVLLLLGEELSEAEED